MSSHNRYVYLLCGLLFFLLVSPLARQFFPVHTFLIVDLPMLAGLAIGTWSLTGWHRRSVWGGVLVASAILLLVSELNEGMPALDYAALCAVVVFCVVVALAALRDVLFGGVLDTNRLIGATCVYLLIGVAWAIMYALVDRLTLEPAFTNLVAVDLDRTLDGFIYYSFVTLTTLGYGDISPVSPMARTLAYLEATVGQLYLTILVAALVGRLAPGMRDAVERKLASAGSRM